MIDQHISMRIEASRLDPSRNSIHTLDYGGSVRDLLTENFERDTIVRLVPEDEYQEMREIVEEWENHRCL